MAASAFESAMFSSSEYSAIPRIHSTSAPAQNVSPSLWSTTARAERSTRATVAVSSAISAASNAFLRSGRAMVMREMPRESVLSVTVSLIARTLDATDASLRPGAEHRRLRGVARGR